MKHKIDPNNWYNSDGKSLADLGVTNVTGFTDDQKDKTNPTSQYEFWKENIYDPEYDDISKEGKNFKL